MILVKMMLFRLKKNKEIMHLPKPKKSILVTLESFSNSSKSLRLNNNHYHPERGAQFFVAVVSLDGAKNKTEVIVLELTICNSSN